MYKKVYISLMLPVILSNATQPEIYQLGCSSTTIQKYDCVWELGPNDQARYTVTQKILSPFWLQPPATIPESNIIIGASTLVVKFRNKDYGNIGRQRITLNATNRYGTSSNSVEFYPEIQAIPLPPSGLQIKRKYHDYMEVSWRKPKGVVFYEDSLLYRLRYKEVTEGNWKETSNLKKKNYQFNDVDAFTEYELQISSKFDTFENQSAGWSQWSSKVLTTTDMTKPGSSKNIKIHTTSFTNFTSIHVTWLPPTRRNGPVSKYYVRYKFTDSKWSSKLSSTATWYDIIAKCNTGHIYLVKIGVAAVNVAPDGTEFVGSEEFVAHYVCSSTDNLNIENSDTDASMNSESNFNEMHVTTGLIVILSMIGIFFLVIFLIVIYYKRSKLHGNPKIEWRFMHLEGPSPQQTETEVFDELPRRQQIDTVTNDANSIPHSSSGLGTSGCISASNEQIEKNSICSFDDSSEFNDKINNERLKDHWPVSEDFSYVTNDFK